MSQLNIRREGHLYEIILDRPDKYNAFSLAMIEGLADAYHEAEQDPEARCILVSANGKHFTTGLDLAEVGPAVAAGHELFQRNKTDPFELFGQRRSKPVVYAVKGYCYTVGIELVLAADICVAQRDTTFAQIEVQRGIMAFGGATIRLTQRMGYGNAMRYLLTGDSFSGEEAWRMGMVQELTEGDPYPAARAIADRICDQAPLAVQATLLNARKAVREGDQAAIDDFMPVTHQLMATEDAAEGIRSFVERRKAVYTGK